MSYELIRKVVPSYPAPSFAELERLFDVLKGVTDEVQVDMVDGKFAPFCSWPFTETDVYEALKKLASFTDDFIVETDCMVEAPEQYLDEFTSLGVQRVVVHMRSTEQYERIIAHARAHGYTLGFALTNDVPLAELIPYIDSIDFVQLMGIKEIGQQGQPFDERTLGRAEELRNTYPELELAVDGSVNAQTIPQLLSAEVNRFAPGSAITKASDPAGVFRELAAMVN